MSSTFILNNPHANIMKNVNLNLLISRKNLYIKIIPLIFSILIIFQTSLAQKSLKLESEKLIYL